MARRDASRKTSAAHAASYSMARAGPVGPVSSWNDHPHQEFLPSSEGLNNNPQESRAHQLRSVAQHGSDHYMMSPQQGGGGGGSAIESEDQWQAAMPSHDAVHPVQSDSHSIGPRSDEAEGWQLEAPSEIAPSSSGAEPWAHEADVNPGTSSEQGVPDLWRGFHAGSQAPAAEAAASLHHEPATSGSSSSIMDAASGCEIMSAAAPLEAAEALDDLSAAVHSRASIGDAWHHQPEQRAATAAARKSLMRSCSPVSSLSGMVAQSYPYVEAEHYTDDFESGSEDSIFS